jgi:O-antigen ligase
LFLVPLIFDMGCDDPTGAPKLMCWLLAAGLACLQPRLPRNGPWLMLTLWLGWSLLSAWSWGPSFGWLTLMPVAIGWLWSLGRPVAWPWLALGWGGTVAYSWLQRLGLDPAGWTHPELSSLRTIAGLANPNYLAMYLAALCPLMWTRLYRRGGPGYLVAFISLSALYLTATRGSILALACVLVLSTLVSRLRDRRFWLITWVLFLGCGAFSLQVAGNSRYSLRGAVVNLNREGGDESVQARWQLWAAAWRQGWQNPWLGVGPGHYGDHYLLNRPVELERLRKMPRRPEDPHNEPLRVWSETGAIGLLLWSSWIGLALWRRRRDWGAETASLLVLLANGMTNCYPLAVWPLLILWTLPPPPPRTGSLNPVGGMVLLLTLLAGGASWLTQRAFWWDEDIKLYPQQSTDLRALRLRWLEPVQTYCPPWYAEELAIRSSQAWQSLAATGAEPAAWERAESWARLRLQLNPEGAYAWAMLADLAQSRQLWSQAVPLWRGAVQRDPRNPAFQFFLARAQYYSGDWRSALESCRQSLEIYSKSSQVYQFRSQIMIEQGFTWEGYWDWVRSQQIRSGE